MSQDQAGPTTLGAKVGADVGGTLCKLVFFEPYQFDEQEYGQICQWLKSSDKYGSSGRRDLSLEIDLPELHGRLHFLQFMTGRMEGAIKLILKNNLQRGLAYIIATGGGAHRFQERFKEALGITLVPRDELGTIVSGIVFLLKNKAADEIYSVKTRRSDDERRASEVPLIRQPMVVPETDLFPLLLCNVGSGVSIVKVEGLHQFTRVSGTAVGGGTFLGLCRMLTKATTFDEALELASAGDSRKVNLLVKDIYGGDLKSTFSLPGELIASFFAKTLGNDPDHIRDGMDDADICHAVCTMIAQNITQIVHMTARVHKLSQVFFTGNFLRHNDVAQKTIAYNMQRWVEMDGVQTDVYFFKHEGYFGAIGALLETLDPDFHPPRNA